MGEETGQSRLCEIRRVGEGAPQAFYSHHNRSEQKTAPFILPTHSIQKRQKHSGMAIAVTKQEN